MATTSIADKLAKLEKKIAKREKTIADETKELDKDRAEYNKLYIPFEKTLSEEQIDVFHKILDCVSDTAVKHSSFPHSYSGGN